MCWEKMFSEGEKSKNLSLYLSYDYTRVLQLS